jgi:hypothetical protein
MIEICTLKNIQNTIEVGRTKASEMRALLRVVLEKPKPKIITMKEFKEYYQIP